MNYVYDEELLIKKAINNPENWQIVNEVWNILSKKKSPDRLVITVTNEDNYKIQYNDKSLDFQCLDQYLQQITVISLHSYMTGRKLPCYIKQFN